MTTTSPAHLPITARVVEEPPDAQRPLWNPLLWVALGASLLPIGFQVGLPFQLSPADVLLPLALPFLLVHRPAPRPYKLLSILVLWTLAVLLVWALLAADDPQSEIQSWVFFWKSWIAVGLAYMLIHQATDRRAAVHRVLRLAVWAQVVLIIMIFAGWSVTGNLVSGGRNDLGGTVTGFTAGAWDVPVKLYGFGQVNVTAALLSLAGPIFGYRAMSTTNPVGRLFWLAWIPASWWLILNSGSRGALVTAGLFIGLLFLASKRSVGRISIITLLISAAVSVTVLSQAQTVLDASPKYARTLNEIRTGDTSAVTSGRDEINALSLADIQRSPFFGTGFGDYSRFHTDQDTDWVNSSPHNTYLGAFHKGGIPVGIGYLALMWTVLPRRRTWTFKGTEFLTLPLTIPIAVGVFPVGDALTTPVLAATILTISGAMLAAHKIEEDEGIESRSDSRD